LAKSLYALKDKRARHQWLRPIILTTWKAKIKRIEVRGQPWQIVHEKKVWWSGSSDRVSA
jgi:hypothetical protein